jgi:hypothetical protein
MSVGCSDQVSFSEDVLPLLQEQRLSGTDLESRFIEAPYVSRPRAPQDPARTGEKFGLPVLRGPRWALLDSDQAL